MHRKAASGLTRTPFLIQDNQVNQWRFLCPEHWFPKFRNSGFLKQEYSIMILEMVQQTACLPVSFRMGHIPCGFFWSSCALTIAVPARWNRHVAFTALPFLRPIASCRCSGRKGLTRSCWIVFPMIIHHWLMKMKPGLNSRVRSGTLTAGSIRRVPITGKKSNWYVTSRCLGAVCQKENQPGMPGVWHRKAYGAKICFHGRRWNQWDGCAQGL